mmetsp:Transcript_5003/g.7406  ORF Transcript_5003/g.7406 Transcript_5003/m.7406 type:complete len:248 (+) Transcript_5003:13-756(+)
MKDENDDEQPIGNICSAVAVDNIHDDLLERKMIIEDKKNIAGAKWNSDVDVVELTKMRGNFWRTTGFSKQSRNFLFPEEALFLVERYMLLVERDGKYFDFDRMYEEVIKTVPLSCYLTYVKLKTLDYAVFRHGTILTRVGSDEEIFQLLQSRPSDSLLECLVSYDVYPHDSSFSKKNRHEIQPLAFIIVYDGDTTPSARVMLTLLEEAKGVPIILALSTPTGAVLLEEFTDSLITLNLENSIALPEL